MLKEESQKLLFDSALGYAFPIPFFQCEQGQLANRTFGTGRDWQEQNGIG